ncbi:MAG TPA: hypothetical protein VFM18_07215 [Methanosarcina sp.]|nr:hypothetical protein [Methanosarcina sp.]
MEFLYAFYYIVFMIPFQYALVAFLFVRDLGKTDGKKPVVIKQEKKFDPSYKKQDWANFYRSNHD